jgi:hypothetical protein
MGYTKTVPISTANINYVAGYTAKKLGDTERQRPEQVDPETGEVYQWIAPFIQMSRQPGIGGKARRHVSSWRSYAISNGQKQPVPRFLHEAWKKTATREQIEQLEREKHQNQIDKQITLQQLDAQHQITVARQAIKAAKRKL